MADNAIGFGQCGIDRGFVADLVKERLVARVLVPDRWRIRRKRSFGADCGGQRLVADVDQFGGVLCLVQCVGDDERDRISDIADAITRQQWLRTDEGGGAIAPPAADLRHQSAETAAAQILARQYRHHTGSGQCTLGIERGNAGMGMRRAQHIAARFVRLPDIVDIPASAFEQA